jgi:hypothetical protein
MIGYQISAADS